MRIHGRDSLYWDGLMLGFGKKGRVAATVISDPDWPNMYRVQTPGRDLSDMLNLSRAKNSAVTLAMAALNTEEAAA